MQSLLELREAQADAKAERRLEHLRQVRGKAASASGTPLSPACLTSWLPVSTGSAAAQGDCPGCSHNSGEETKGDERQVKAEDLVWVGRGPPWCQDEGRAPSLATDPSSSSTGSSREKKELQKILDRKRHNSISEAKTREKHKKEA